MSIMCYNVTNSRPGPDAIYLTAMLQSDNKPDPMPLTGVGIEGMEDAERLDAGSRLLVLADGGSEWVLGQDHTWYKQERAGGGGEPDRPKSWEEAYEDPIDVYNETRPKEWPKMIAADSGQVCLLIEIPEGVIEYSYAVRMASNNSAENRCEIGYIDRSGNLAIISDETLPYQDGRVDFSIMYAEIPDDLAAEDGRKYAIVRISNLGGTFVRFYDSEYADPGAIDTNIVEMRININPDGRIYLGDTATVGNGAIPVFLGGLKYLSILGGAELYSGHTIPNSPGYPYKSAVPHNVVSIIDFDVKMIPGLAFANCKRLRGVPDLSALSWRGGTGSYVGYEFYGCESLRASPKLPDLTRANSDRIFTGCKSMMYVHPDTFSGDGFAAERLCELFRECESLISSPDIIGDRITSVSYIFAGCKSLEAIPTVKIGAGADMRHMFDGCEKVKSAEGIPFEIAGNAEGIMLGCVSIESVGDLSMPYATDISSAFSGCTSLVRAGEIAAPNATKAERLFYGCQKLKNVGDVTIPAATTIGSAFYKCESLEKGPSIHAGALTKCDYAFYSCTMMLSAFMPASDVPYSMRSLFASCSSLVDVYAEDGNAPASTTMEHAFSTCTRLEHIPKIDTSSATSIVGALRWCAGVREYPAWDTGNVKSFDYAFRAARRITRIGPIDMSNAVFGGSYTGREVFYTGNLLSLEIVGLGKNGKTLSTNLFEYGYNSASKKPLAHLTYDPTVEGWAGYNISAQWCSIEHGAMIELFNSLPTITSAKNLTITGNPGADGLTTAEIEIATAKGWNVVGATNIIE